MIGAFSKLLYILTFSPFHPQSEFLNFPGLAGENDEFSTLEKNETGTGIKRRTRRLAVPMGGMDSLSNLALKNIRETQDLSKEDLESLSRLKDLGFSGLGALISRFALSLVTNQTLVFLFGFSYAVHLVAVFFSILELFVAQEKNAEHGRFWDFIKGLLDFGGALFNTGVIASIFYYFYPPQPLLRVGYVQVLPSSNPAAADPNMVVVEHKP